MTEYLDPEDILDWVLRRGLHLRDALFLSAMASPMPVFDEEIYPDIHAKAAALLSALNRNHPLLDGNKSLSWMTTLAFHEINGIDIVVQQPSEIDSFIRLAAADEVPLHDVAGWLQAHAHPFIAN